MLTVSRPSAIVSAGLLVLAAGRAEATFTKVTTGDIVTTPARYWTASWGDYDDDGYLDLFAGADFGSTRNFLYHNEGDGTFTLVDPAAIPKVPSNQHGSAWADYDNDGHLDLFVTAGNFFTGNGEIHNAIYRNNGDGTFTVTTSGPLYDAGGGFHAPSWADYDEDGLVDLFIAGHGAVNRLYRNAGDGTFPRVTSTPIVQEFGASECRSFVDYDDDGDVDLFVGNADQTHTNFLYRNDGNGKFTPVADSGLSNNEDTWGCSWADYDNDGHADLFLANTGGHPNSLYHNEGDGTFTDVTETAGLLEPAPPNENWVSPAWGDYDNDGFVDLFVTTGNCYPDPTNCVPRTNALYHNEGDGTFTKVTEGPVVNDVVTQCPAATWGDYDRDGFLDLFVAQGAVAPTPQTNLLYHNDGNANAWLNVKLIGTRSNRSAIGARVRVNAFYGGASRWQLRDVSGGDSNNNQQSLDAEFGLADAPIVDTVRIEWPSGRVQQLHDVATRQFLTVTEPGVRPACEDGIDDDGDGLVDMADPGCPLPFASPENPLCDDGIDNDGNGLVDFADPKCQLGWPYWENAPKLSCGLGGEIALLIAPLLFLRRRLRRD